MANTIRYVGVTAANRLRRALTTLPNLGGWRFCALVGAAVLVAMSVVGSDWHVVALHWLVVVVWQTWLVGPGLEALRG